MSAFLLGNNAIYERSMFWANFMSKYSKKESGVEIEISEIPDGSSEDDEDEINDENQFALEKISSKDLVPFAAKEDEDTENCVSDSFLSKAFPFVHEQRELWRKSGMNEILETFDPQKIHTNIKKFLQIDHQKHNFNQFSAYKENRNIEKEYSSDESFESVGAADYKLSTRKRHRETICSSKRMIFKYEEEYQNSSNSQYRKLFDIFLKCMDNFSSRNRLLSSNPNRRIIRRRKMNKKSRDTDSFSSDDDCEWIDTRRNLRYEYKKFEEEHKKINNRKKNLLAIENSRNISANVANEYASNGKCLQSDASSITACDCVPFSTFVAECNRNTGKTQNNILPLKRKQIEGASHCSMAEKESKTDAVINSNEYAQSASQNSIKEQTKCSCNELNVINKPICNDHDKYQNTRTCPSSPVPLLEDFILISSDDDSCQSKDTTKSKENVLGPKTVLKDDKFNSRLLSHNKINVLSSIPEKEIHTTAITEDKSKECRDQTYVSLEKYSVTDKENNENKNCASSSESKTSLEPEKVTALKMKKSRLKIASNDEDDLVAGKNRSYKEKALASVVKEHHKDEKIMNVSKNGAVRNLISKSGKRKYQKKVRSDSESSNHSSVKCVENKKELKPGSGNKKSKNRSVSETSNDASEKNVARKCPTQTRKSKKNASKEASPVAKENLNEIVVSSSSSPELKSNPSSIQQERIDELHVNRKRGRKVLLHSAQDGIDSNQFFYLTDDHLTKTIGSKIAEKYLKYNRNIIPRQFKASSTVYFKYESDMDSHPETSDSEEDILDKFHKYGSLVESP